VEGGVDWSGVEGCHESVLIKNDFKSSTAVVIYLFFMVNHFYYYCIPFVFILVFIGEGVFFPAGCLFSQPILSPKTKPAKNPPSVEVCS